MKPLRNQQPGFECILFRRTDLLRFWVCSRKMAIVQVMLVIGFLFPVVTCW